MQVKCFIDNCKHNFQGESCTIETLEISSAVISPTSNCQTECASFEEK